MTALAGTAALTGAQAQSSAPRIALANPSCVDCTLRFEQLAALGRATDRVLAPDVPDAVAEFGGRYVVAAQSTILVYDLAGTLVETWGRQGAGPGEFGFISKLEPFAGGDSLLVVDIGHMRGSVLDRTGTFRRSFTFPFTPSDIATSPHGGWLASGMYPTPGRVGFPLHQLTREGTVSATLPLELAVLRNRPSAAQRRIAVGVAGMWSVRPDRYEIESWSSTGQLRSVLDRVVSWFPDREVEGARRTWRDPIQPWVYDIRADTGDLVWVLTSTAAEGWQPSPESFGRTSETWMHRQSMIELINVKSATVVASSRLRGAPVSFTPQGRVATFRQTVDGVIVVDIWRAVLSN